MGDVGSSFAGSGGLGVPETTVTGSTLTSISCDEVFAVVMELRRRNRDMHCWHRFPLYDPKLRILSQCFPEHLTGGAIFNMG